ncbi:uncharacterized protein LOC124295444 [Neodiprion lecontei]|uniref:Uncharacterized protein LOC107226157 n=1 Tax=Neodiprion lecontei TaxID=441921 RepID=A0A6J0C742_NEOLC|nr:uncharacterized protein LOC107226157 [Neodiprion lecontei]XP_046601394.1 uncharacterized protein LOC124295442 [Neodiprion lecontei]XP_046601395.1 uncharacterized protein LOC124295443 [Neodiprion lecontei]XP_046601396.1 uncharacterized protein LOC124295444 [Neodiprion lecontei]
MISAKRIRTTAYHPASNGLIERWHRTLKTALMCNPSIPWPDLLPTVLLELRTVYKEDIKASPAEMTFGTTLRIPGDFFVNAELPAEPEIFLEKHREYMKAIRPTPTSHHIKAKIFIQQELQSCSHVFLRLDEVKPPLKPPYSGPHLVKKCLDDRRFVINIDGDEKTVSIERLKPAFLAKDDSASDHVIGPEDIILPHQQGTMDRPLKTYQKKG